MARTGPRRVKSRGPFRVLHVARSRVSGKKALAECGPIFALICDGWPGLASRCASLAGLVYFAPPAPPATHPLVFTGCRQSAKHAL